MTRSFLGDPPSTVHRIDLPCEQTGFTTPPFDIQIKFLPSPVAAAPEGGAPGWTLIAHAAAGKAEALADWLDSHDGIHDVQVGVGIAPKLLRGKADALPGPWARVASYVRVHHLDVSPAGSASWFIEGPRERILTLIDLLEAEPVVPLITNAVRCRPVQPTTLDAELTRRQFEALASAVAEGYYEIPHRIDLRTLASTTGYSLGSVSELLRRAEASVLSHYIDTKLMRSASQGGERSDAYRPIENLLRR